MAEEIFFEADLKQSLEKAEWPDSGIVGFLIGRVWRGQTHVLNIWRKQNNACADREDLSSELTQCQNHLSAGTDIVGVVVVVTSSKLTDAENYLEFLPLEVQAAVGGPLFVVCTIKKAPAPGETEVMFYHQDPEEKSLRPVKETGAVVGFDSEQVIFRLQARFPLQLQLDNTKPTDIEVWAKKMSKAFTVLQTSVSSGGYTFGFRGTPFFLSDSSVIGSKGKMETVLQLYDAIANEKDIPGHKKNSVANQPPVVVDLYQQVSGETDHFAPPTCAPAVHQRTGSFRYLKCSLPVDAVVEVDMKEKVNSLQSLFVTATTSQLNAMLACLQLHHSKENEFYTPEPVHFTIPHRHTCITAVYPRNIAEDNLVKRRQYLHEKMCLPMNKPLFRRANARLFPGQRAQGGYIVNPHIGLPSSGVAGGTPHVVQGNYSYHHYMQDRFDDDKWGCAYRSLQTLVSWFRFQGYTDTPVPSHRTIQQALVAVGDKESNFVGSKKWIGSFEVSFVLDHLLGVTCKFLNVSAGAELASKGRELAQHFDTEGTPIMIGGGVLAHTILGVDYSEMSGDIRFLILDPHYTGGEDLNTIHREGWCGWKGPEFWNATAHYNMCMPLRPVCF